MTVWLFPSGLKWENGKALAWAYGTSWRARVGRVKSLAFLNSLRLRTGMVSLTRSLRCQKGPQQWYELVKIVRL